LLELRRAVEQLRLALDAAQAAERLATLRDELRGSLDPQVPNERRAALLAQARDALAELDGR
jgi:hypothetical protein